MLAEHRHEPCLVIRGFKGGRSASSEITPRTAAPRVDVLGPCWFHESSKVVAGYNRLWSIEAQAIDLAHILMALAREYSTGKRGVPERTTHAV